MPIATYINRLTANDMRFIEALLAYEQVSLVELSEKMGISTRCALRGLTRLKQDGMVVCVSRGRYARWTLARDWRQRDPWLAHEAKVVKLQQAAARRAAPKPEPEPEPVVSVVPLVVQSSSINRGVRVMREPTPQERSQLASLGLAWG